jgi:hypothetical protein
MTSQKRVEKKTEKVGGVASRAEPKAEGITVEVPSYLVPDDYNRLTDLCIRFDDGLRCHMGVGETRIFLVHPSRVVEANEVLKGYGVVIANGKQVKPGDSSRPKPEGGS